MTRKHKRLTRYSPEVQEAIKADLTIDVGLEFLSPNSVRYRVMTIEAKAGQKPQAVIAEMSENAIPFARKRIDLDKLLEYLMQESVVIV